MQIDSHLFAAFTASQTAYELLNLLPRVDIVEEISTILYMQNEVLLHMIQNKHFGTDSLKEFIDSCLEIQRDLDKTKEVNEWKSE